MKADKLILPVLAAGHGLNDLLAGYLLGTLAAQQDAVQAGTGLFIYNLLAFGGQYPFALWIEKAGSHKRFITGAYILNLLAVILFAFLPHLSVVLIGVASAIYHVGGGTVCARENKSVNIGLFAAPGVAGLIAGGYLAWADYQLDILLLLLTGLFLLILYLLKIPGGRTDKKNSYTRPSVMPDRHDLIMILLLTVISLRSAVWNIFQLIHENNYSWLIAIAIAAFTGKIAGGWIADKIGWRLYIFISLFTAAPLIHFFRHELLPFCIGIGLLQSGIPATTSLLIHSVNGKTERGIGLSFGAAIILGALVFAIPVGYLVHSLILPAALMLCIVLFMYFSVRGKVVLK